MSNVKNNISTFYLFANPSFLEGTARLIDVCGALNMYNESETNEEADFRALRSDWLAVGQDLMTAMSYERGKTLNRTK